mmetsp:Transcript_3789/g.8207  ORF Transcript_3789/g.8207 Transcript_3789/m.8207 type:complete len:407 (+) Transcript_3789:261-1481(+)|eukprot:CAMPEP_0171522244 /NCGR_PEP_ID=MMETSP0959-20130129/7630_1 /TAXON_ID=87120 /ORGANISM="Aurantiochytrium limacinum, Strain ATCCMYA-1381" /LENGTH=406 /DNA_ID=CAMNT_0012062335 /DNA_START=140 /DNA_END=1360 /DNA_ORIENTATION=-
MSDDAAKNSGTSEAFYHKSSLRNSTDALLSDILGDSAPPKDPVVETPAETKSIVVESAKAESTTPAKVEPSPPKVEVVTIEEVKSEPKSVDEQKPAPFSSPLPSEEEVMQAIANLLTSGTYQGKVSGKAVREKLEQDFNCSLMVYMGAIRREVAVVVDVLSSQKGTQQTKSTNPLETPTAAAVPPNLASQRTISGLSSGVKSKGDDALSLPGASQDTAVSSLPGNSQEPGVSGRFPVAADLLDTRHDTTEDPAKTGRLPLVFPKKLQSIKPTSMPVLMELHGQAINVRGDAGAIGRVALIAGQNNDLDNNDATKRPHGNAMKKGKASKKAKLMEMAQKYQDGSVLRIDLKGHVYHGTMVPSSVTLLGVAMARDKVTVQGVWNEYMQCTYKGNVMEGMDGKVEDAAN